MASTTRKIERTAAEIEKLAARRAHVQATQQLGITAMSRFFAAMLATIGAFVLSPSAKAQDAPKYEWTLGAPLFSLAKANSDEPLALLDPCVVLDGDKWHLFATAAGGTYYYTLDNWKTDGKIQRGKKLPLDGVIVPQVYFHRASKQWHLIGMISQMKDGAKRWLPCLSTNDKVGNPDGWTKPAILDVPPALDDKEKPVNWMDFYVICDDQKAHLFATSANRLWRSETKLADYPKGWSKPVVALKADFKYASHTYRQETKKGTRFLTTLTSTEVDSTTKKARQNQHSYVAERLEGPWQPESATTENPFAGLANIRIIDKRWSGELVHGEPIRQGNDERMLLEHDITGFVFHGRAKVKDEEKAASINCVGVLLPASPK